MLLSGKEDLLVLISLWSLLSLQLIGTANSPLCIIAASLYSLNSASLSNITWCLQILQIFHRKIYPENDVESRKITKSSKHKSKHATSSCSGSNCFVGGGGDSLMTPSERTCRKGNKCGSDQPSLSLDGSDCTSSREHWIKTDADCEY